LEGYYGDGDPENLYRRVPGRAELLDGTASVSCWLYEYLGPLLEARLLHEGVWEHPAHSVRA
jgi:hypothetical protein